jgi:hypothetical protein
MTQLFGLLNHVFGNLTRDNDLEIRSNSQNPNSHQQVELFRYYMNQYSTNKGL